MKYVKYNLFGGGDTFSFSNIIESNSKMRKLYEHESSSLTKRYKT